MWPLTFGQCSHASWEGVSGLGFLAHYFLWELYGPGSQDWHLRTEVIVENPSSGRCSRSLAGSALTSVPLCVPPWSFWSFSKRRDVSKQNWLCWCFMKLSLGKKECICTLKNLCLGGATENVAASCSCVVFLSSLFVILKKHSVANFRFLTVQLQTFRRLT